MREPLNINFGCGGNLIPDWKNHDIDVDLTKLPLPYDDNSADIVLLEHIAEHLSSPDCLRCFEDCLRILKPNGILRVCVPVISTKLKREHVRDLIVGHTHLIMFDENILVTALWAAGFELDNIKITDRKECDGHWRVIGEEKDSIESLRIEAIKGA